LVLNRDKYLKKRRRPSAISVQRDNPEPSHWAPRRWGKWLAKRWLSVQLLQKTLNVNTFSVEQLRAVLFKDIWTVRVNDTFERPEMATDLMEHNLEKLAMLYQRGGESYARYEIELRKMLLSQPAQQTEGS
jgi:hypothetical protein